MSRTDDGSSSNTAASVTSTPSFLAAEARGDWTGFKGAHYHIAYALHRLLRGTAASVAFYAGNDLLTLAATPGPLPAEMPAGSGLSINVSGTDPQRDEWEQLKSGSTAWTVGELLKENLLANFVWNALLSEQRGRQWTVRLVSPAEVRRDALRNFAAAPDAQPDNCRKLRRIVTRVTREWRRWLRREGTGGTVPVRHVHDLARRVVRHIADGGPVPVEYLEEAVRSDLAFLFPDPAAVPPVTNALLGAVLNAAKTAPDRPLVLSLAWLEAQTELSLRPRDLLSQNVVAACSAQAERSAPADWTAALCAPRPRLLGSLSEFLASDRTLFVVSGESGAGKTWFSTDWAVAGLTGRARVRLDGSHLLHSSSLASLVSGALAPFARADMEDQEVLRRVLAAAKPSGVGAFVVVVDDVPLPPDPTDFLRRLTAICREATDAGVKLVVFTRESVWRRAVGDAKSLAPYLYRQTPMTGGPPSFSVALSALTDEEVADILRRSLPSGIPWRPVARQLRQPPFASIRTNAYRLGLFARQHLRWVARDGGVLPPAVDDLLKEEWQRVLDAVALRLQAEPGEVAAALFRLVALLWDRRASGGATAGDVTSELEAGLNGLGRVALRALLVEDVLAGGSTAVAPSASVMAVGLGLSSSAGDSDRFVFANPQFGDFLTARWLASRLAKGEDILSDMVAGQDDGAMTALIRGALDHIPAAVPEPLAWAEGTLNTDGRWLAAVADGVAQRADADGWRSLALLESWANAEQVGAEWDAMRTYRFTAPRSRRARRWVASLYLDEEQYLRLKGEIALGACLDVLPRWAARVVALRLARDLARPTTTISSNENQARSRFVRGALEPLRQIGTAEAAAVAAPLLRRAAAAEGGGRQARSRDVREGLGELANVLRGQIARLDGPDALRAVIADLGSADATVRREASQALLAVAAEEPEAIRDPVLEAVGREDTRVLPHLLRILSHFTDSDPDRVLDAVAVTGVAARAAAGCGMALALLAKLAPTRPARVRQLLPRGLHTEIPPDMRAILGALLSYAWGCYSTTAPEDADAKSVLEALSYPDFTDLSRGYGVFAAYTAGAAVLCRMGDAVPGLREALPGADLAIHYLALEVAGDLIYPDLAGVCEQLAPDIVAHPLCPALLDVFSAALRNYKEELIHPIETGPSEWQFRIANIVTDSLAVLAAQLPAGEVLDLVRILPRDWPAIRVCGRVFAAGRASDELVEYGCSVCAQHANVIGNVSEDRDRFLHEVRLAGRLPPAYRTLEDTQIAPANHGTTTAHLAVASAPDRLLIELHRGAAAPHDALGFLWQWPSQARTWPGVLLGRVLRSAFPDYPLNPVRVRRLCHMTLAAVEGIPPGAPLVSEYRNLFAYLEARLVTPGTPTVPPPDLTTSLGEGVLSHSLTSAAELIRKEGAMPDANATDEEWRDWLVQFMADSAGWVEDQHNWVEGGSVHGGVQPGRPGFVVPPALRLALYAVTHRRFGRGEWLLSWLEERRAAHAVTLEYSCRTLLDGTYLRFHVRDRVRRCRTAMRLLDDAVAAHPRSGELHFVRGFLYLLHNDYVEAGAEFETCLALPDYPRGTHTSALYSLARACARLGDEEGCRKALEKAVSRGLGLPRLEMRDDPDLDSVRDKDWFEAVMAALPESGSEEPTSDSAPAALVTNSKAVEERGKTDER
jgi:hypothetical protein